MNFSPEEAAKIMEREKNIPSQFSATIKQAMADIIELHKQNELLKNVALLADEVRMFDQMQIGLDTSLEAAGVGLEAAIQAAREGGAL